MEFTKIYKNVFIFSNRLKKNSIFVVLILNHFKMSKKISLLIVLLSLILFGCEKFVPAELHMTALYDPITQIVTCKVTITDNGGCTNFTEQGGIFSLNETPSHLDQYSTVEIVEKNSKEMTFVYETRLPQLDVTYYLRAYVKTNAGTGYSNIIAIETINK